jgi:hypothetical protein
MPSKIRYSRPHTRIRIEEETISIRGEFAMKKSPRYASRNGTDSARTVDIVPGRRHRPGQPTGRVRMAAC